MDFGHTSYYICKNKYEFRAACRRWPGCRRRGEAPWIWLDVGILHGDGSRYLAATAMTAAAQSEWRGTALEWRRRHRSHVMDPLRPDAWDGASHVLLCPLDSQAACDSILAAMNYRDGTRMRWQDLREVDGSATWIRQRKERKLGLSELYWVWSIYIHDNSWKISMTHLCMVEVQMFISILFAEVERDQCSNFPCKSVEEKIEYTRTCSSRLLEQAGWGVVNFV